MKKFTLFFIFFYFIFNIEGNAYADDKVILDCKNKKHDYSYTLIVDLTGKTMKLYEMNPFTITNIEETAIYAEHHSYGMKRYLVFQRYTGELDHTILYNYDDKVHTAESYNCKKAKKIL